MTSAAGTDVWARTWLGWDAAFYAGTAALAVTTATDDDVTGSRAVAIAALAVLAGWYAATGARAMRTRSERLAVVYLAGMVPLFLVAFAQYGVLGLLLFILYSQCWALVDRQVVSITAAVALTAGVAGVTLVAFAASPREALAQAAVALAFTLLMGLWIGRIVDQSADRRAVIAELEATRAELAEVSHRAGVLAERERLAGEIHDTLAQGFTSVLMLVELADAELAVDPAAARGRLAAAGETARQNLAEARSLVAALGPADLQAASLPEAVGRLVDRFGRESGRPAGFTVAGRARALPANPEVVLLRAAQEALANVRKHARASRVALTLSYMADLVVLDIRDDGVGFDPESVRKPHYLRHRSADMSGFGLGGMRERAERVGGKLLVDSTPGEGTTLAIELPLTVKPSDRHADPRNPKLPEKTGHQSESKY